MTNMAQNTIEPVLLIHGGAGDIPESKVQGKLDGIRKAVCLGYEKLKDTGCVLEATQTAVEYMEEDDNFNAGRGSVLTTQGEIEMEALIVDGRDIKVGKSTGCKKILVLDQKSCQWEIAAKTSFIFHFPGFSIITKN